MIDLHSHILPGIDDGSRSEQQSLDTLRRLEATGITDIVATPHLRAAGIATRGEEMVERRDLLLDALRRAFHGHVRLHPGFEIMLDAPLPEYVTGDRRFAIAGSRYYLVEFPTSIGAAPASAALAALAQTGVTPLVAHPERYHTCTARDFVRWRSLGAVLQVDATTLTRPTSRGDMARAMIRAGLADVLAADNHGDQRVLATGRRWLEERGAGGPAALLTSDNPRAVLEGQALMPVPPAKLRVGLRERVRGWIREVEG